MAQFVRAFLKDHFDHRDVKEQQYNHFCIEKGYESRQVAEVIWNDPTFPEKPGNLRKGMVNQKEWEEGLALARKELGDAIVDLAEKEFDKEKAETEAHKKEMDELGKKMAKEDKSCYTRLDAGSKAGQVEFLLPKLIKCNDQTNVLVAPKDAEAAKDAGLEMLFIRLDGEEGEIGPIVALKKFASGDTPEFCWKADSLMGCKMTPYAVYSKAGVWKGDRVAAPWTAELHEDPDADVKEMEEMLKKFGAEMQGPQKFSDTYADVAPEEEWLSEQKNEEAVKMIKAFDEEKADIGFVR